MTSKKLFKKFSRVNLNNALEVQLANKESQITFPQPPGYTGTSGTNDVSTEEGAAVITQHQRTQAVQRQILMIAYSPGKALFSTAFMLWMSGSSIQIFSIMMTGMALINPLKAISTTNKTFEKFQNEEGVDLRLAKLIFVSLQLLSFFVAVYKTHTMGLLPVTSGDWTFYIPARTYAEVSSIPL